MLSEEKQIFFLVKKFISYNCDVERFETEDISKKKFKCYFKKDENNCFNIYDKEFSIKCVFEKEFLKEYFSLQPSYINIDCFDCK